MLVVAIACAMARPACTLSHHALEPKNVFEEINFNSCNKTGDESQQSCKQNIVVRHFELESFHLRLDPSI